MDQKPQDLTPALAEACEKTREFLAKADLGNACVRYDIGAIIARIKGDPDTFGRKAVERLEWAVPGQSLRKSDSPARCDASALR